MKQNGGLDANMPGLSGAALASLYVAAAALPMLAVWVGGIEPAPALSELGTAFGLTAAALLYLQFLSSGRYEAISGRIGIDRTMGFHRVAAFVLLAFVLLHPLSYTFATLIVDPVAAWHRLTGMLASNRLRTGVLALAGLTLIIAVATIRSRPFIRYEYWRMSHGLLAIAVAALTLQHALAAGTYSAEYPLRAVWLLFALMAAGAIGVVYFVRPWRMWREDWRVERISALADRVWEMTLRGPDTTRLRFRAGQFIWMTLAPHRPPFHDHPFSIASAAADLPRLRLIVRESGNCTDAFGAVAPGTRVAIDGPHGSFVLPDGSGRVAMIAGGVGIAPLLGILEEAAARGDRRPFRLLYAARNPATLAGLARLRDLQSKLDLLIHCVVDEGARGSDCSAGPISDRHISRLFDGALAGEATALVCGPPGMMEIATDALLAAGVPAKSICYERFDFGAGKGRLDKVRRREALLPFLALVAMIAAFSLR
ncbi:MAG: ferric reductase-like transmembrane domain-containing protein [Methyloceanibacter sp.]